jgi:hypothetical protein
MLLGDVMNSRATVVTEDQDTVEIHDNGNTLALLTRTGESTSTLVITFEAGVKARYSKKKLLSRPSFGRSFLTKIGCDVLSFSRRNPRWYQDLSLEQFGNIVEEIAKSYQRVYLYGSSGGAYAALYFSKCNDFIPIAISPRMSIHPEFGSPKYLGAAEFLHEPIESWSIPEKSGAVIYDPHDQMDNKYVREVLKRAFPNIQYIKVPHSGHPSGLVMTKSGQLQQLVRSYIKDEPVQFEGLTREAKRTRFYLFNLARFAAKKLRYRAALRLLKMSEQMPEMGKKASAGSIAKLRERCLAELNKASGKARRVKS